MRKRLLTLATLFFALTAAAAAPPQPASYAGKWTLDAAQSKNLPKFYERITKHALKIKQSPATLNVAVTISLGDQDDHFDFAYKLDGTETKTETSIHTPDGPLAVPTTLSAKVKDDGGLTITISRDVPNLGKGVTVEDWQLSQDGNMLTIHRVDDRGPGGKIEADMVFVRS
jgi:hypothetical protein